MTQKEYYHHQEQSVPYNIKIVVIVIVKHSSMNTVFSPLGETKKATAQHHVEQLPNAYEKKI